MKTKKEKSSDSVVIRKKAEMLLKNKQIENLSAYAATEPLRIVHELEVQQIELKLQNEELEKEKEEAEIASLKYIELFDFAPSGYFTLTREGKIMELNLCGSKMLGKVRSDLINNSFGFFVSYQTKPFFDLFLRKIFSNSMKETCEVTFSLEDNSTLDVILTGIVTANGNLCVVNAVDISELKKANEALQKSEERNRSIILRTAMDGFWLMDMQGRLLEVNETYCRMSGYSMQELITMNLAGIEVAESAQDTAAHLERIILYGEDRFETRHRRKDGSIFDVEISVQYQPLQGGRFVSFLHDITERKLAEENLRQSEERYKTLFQGNHSVMLLIDPETGEIKDANPAASRFYGWTLSELRRKNILEINSLSRQELKTEMKKAKEEKRNHFYLKHRLANGEVRDVEIFSGPIKFRETTLLYSIIHDITDRKLAEKALADSEQKFRKYIDFAPHGIFVANEKGEYLEVNSVACKMTGYSKEELLSMKIIDLVPQEALEVAIRHFNRAVNEGFASDDLLFIRKDQSKGFWTVDAVKLAENRFLGFVVDITERRQAEEALMKSEESIRVKLESILAPEGSLADLELNEIIDAPSIQKLMDNFYQLAQIPMAIIDKKGKVLVGIGWQDICAKFHRVHPEACRNCFESDVHLTYGIPDGEFKLYKCKNNMWDMATPIIIGGEHKGNLYMGQFFFDDQTVEEEIFRKQANQYGFEEREYLDALAAVPRLSIKKLDYAKEFFLNFAHTVSKLSYSNIKLARAIEQQKNDEYALKKMNEELEDRVLDRTSELLKSHEKIRLAEEKYRTIADYNFDWETWLGPDGKYIYVSPSCYRISGYSVDEFMNDPTLFYRIAHPDDQETVEKHRSDTLKIDNISPSFDFRIIARNGQERWISHSSQPVYNAGGKWLGQRESNTDITERKKVESFLINSQDKLRALTQHMNEVTENERKSIAREIHDELGHMLTALKYDIDSLMSNSALTVEQVNNELPMMYAMVESLIESVRKIATELRPGLLDHLGLFPAMEWQINQFRMMTKIDCTYDIPDDLDVIFDKNETTTIFRILQEMLTNVAKHSKADKIEISARKENDLFNMNVNDNGVGFVLMERVQSGSLGLMGMNERALSIGGEIHIISEPGKGTSISLLLPKK